MRGSKAGAWAVAAACVAVATPVLVAAPATADSKVTICHRTHSTSNPYRRITVGISAVNGSGGNDHTHHWAALFDPTYAYPPNAKVWGDIIPVGNGGQTGSNWTAAGQAMYASAQCGVLSPQAFYNAEREAGVAKAVIVADLKEQGADGDPAPASFDAMTYTGTTDGVTDTSPAPVITTTTDPAVNPQASPSPSPTPSASPSDTPSPSPSASPSDSPSASPSASPSSAAESPSPGPTASPAASPSPGAASAGATDVAPPPAPAPADAPVVPTSPAPDAPPAVLDEPQPLPTDAVPTATTTAPSTRASGCCPPCP